MLRVLTYNIQTGGAGRLTQLVSLIKGTGADVIGLTEVTRPEIAEGLASELGMQLHISGQGTHERDWHLGLLSRLPLIETRVHALPEVFAKQYVLEAQIEDEDGQQIKIFVAHLMADFHRGVVGNRLRRREVEEILRMMAVDRGTPHLLMGDFNAIAPGDSFRAGTLFSAVMSQEQESLLRQYTLFRGQESPDQLTIRAMRLISGVTRKRWFTLAANSTGLLYAPRAGIELLSEAGYVDCYRQLNADKKGFTYPSIDPAGRIDFLFASPELAERLQKSYVVVAVDGVRGAQASDHLPVFAEFG